MINIHRDNFRHKGRSMPNDVEVLQTKLDNLLRIAKSNDQKHTNFQEYELQLLNSSDLYELLSIILEQHSERFQLSNVTLMLIDPEYEFQRLLDNLKRPASWKNRLLFSETEHIIGRYFSVLRKPRLMPFSTNVHQALFPAANNLQSIAILPLFRQNKLIGSLNLGSRNPDRFQGNFGTQFLQHLAAVIAASIENARLHENIKQLGLLDPLTGINNRRFFDQRIEEEVNLAQRNQLPLSCLFIDLDHFKRINDTHGHQAGDSILKQVASILSDIMRTTDVLARFGGEEFVILLSNTASNLARDIAERIRLSIESTQFAISVEKSIDVTLSIGMATMIENPKINTTKQLIEAADQAVYNAKLSGRNRVHYAA
jgi:two-component system cell cycle response regulator